MLRQSEPRFWAFMGVDANGRSSSGQRSSNTSRHHQQEVFVYPSQALTLDVKAIPSALCFIKIGWNIETPIGDPLTPNHGKPTFAFKDALFNVKIDSDYENCELV